MDRREICRRYYVSHRDECLRRNADWNRRNPELRREYKRRSNARRADKNRAYRKAYYKAHREEIRVRMEEWRAKNKDAIREYERVRMLNPEVRERRKRQRQTREAKRRAEARIASLGFSLFGVQDMAEDKKTTYINSPFKPSTAKRIKALAKKNNRPLGRQVVWIVERFLEER